MPQKLGRRKHMGFLADLLKIIKLRGAGADDVKEVQETMQHL